MGVVLMAMCWCLAATLIWGVRALSVPEHAKRRGGGGTGPTLEETPRVAGVACVTARCGAWNEGGAVFCRQCGERLVGSPMFDAPSHEVEGPGVWRRPGVGEERGVRW